MKRTIAVVLEKEPKIFYSHSVNGATARRILRPSKQHGFSANELGGEHISSPIHSVDPFPCANPRVNVKQRLEAG